MDLFNLNIGDELMCAGDTFTRPLNEYPKVDAIVNYILDVRNIPKNIYTKDLNVNGKVVQDSMEKYLESKSYQSSNFKQALVSPLHLNFSLEDDKKELERIRGGKGYFELGTYLHQCILEPTKFSRIVVEPKYSLATKEGVNNLINFWESKISEQGFGINKNEKKLSVNETFELALKEVNILGLNTEKQDGKKVYYYSLKSLSGLESVSEEHFLKINILKKHYENYGGGILERLLKYSKREISVYSDLYDLPIKVRPDALQFKENIGVNAIISIKSTSCEDIRAFYYQSAKLHYDLSEGMYQEIVSHVTGRDFNTTIMIMLQTIPPFGIAIMVWSAEDIEMGKYKFHTALDIAKNCKENNYYQGYDVFAEEGTFGLIQMHLPQWNNKEILPTTIN